MFDTSPHEFSIIPKHLTDGLIDYGKNRHIQGGFLMACLENNFMEAVCRADGDSREVIVEIAKFIYNELPHECHGSPEKVKEWLKAA